jgi:hypothetical protein
MVLQMAVLPCLSVEIRKNVGAANHFLSNHGSLWCYQLLSRMAQIFECHQWFSVSFDGIRVICPFVSFVMKNCPLVNCPATFPLSANLRHHAALGRLAQGQAMTAWFVHDARNEQVGQLLKCSPSAERRPQVYFDVG